ncbi:MAG: thioredoxin family protein [Ignavibacteriales bacterium]|nr:thioredoxin family protein [Ignavibacteriales bacterium]
MQTDIISIEDFSSFIQSNKAAVVYFSTPDCNVCKVLKPKLIEFLSENFPLIKFGYVNIDGLKETAAQKSVFTVPTILFFIEGKEYIRKARFVNFDELEGELRRVYSYLF